MLKTLQPDTLATVSPRDLFAMFALIGLSNAHSLPAKTARAAYEVADAMIAERERQR